MKMKFLVVKMDLACNFYENANVDDGSCYFAEQYYDCDGVCLTDTDGDGVCDELEVSGCTDETAVNYNPVVTIDDGSCELPIYGCTNPNAGNYASEANIDNGSCIISLQEFTTCGKWRGWCVCFNGIY